MDIVLTWTGWFDSIPETSTSGIKNSPSCYTLPLGGLLEVQLSPCILNVRSTLSAALLCPPSHQVCDAYEHSFFGKTTTLSA